MPLNHSNKFAELTDDQFLLVGKIIVEFSNIDFLLRHILGKVLFTPDFLSKTYTDGNNISKTIEQLNNAIDLHERRYHFQLIEQSKIKDIKDTITKVNEVRGFRNKFAHFVWMRRNDSEISGHMLSGKLPSAKKAKRESAVLTNNDLEEIYTKSYKIVDQLDEISNGLSYIEEQELLDMFKGHTPDE